jgi:hypothetical protein
LGRFGTERYAKYAEIYKKQGLAPSNLQKKAAPHPYLRLFTVISLISDMQSDHRRCLLNELRPKSRLLAEDFRNRANESASSRVPIYDMPNAEMCMVHVHDDKLLCQSVPAKISPAKKSHGRIRAAR